MTAHHSHKSLRSLAVQWGASALVALGTDALARRHNRGRTLVLAYHNIVPYGEAPCGDQSLHLPRAQFARQLDLLQETHEIVPAASLPTTTGPNGSPSTPRAVITFDDAYRGALTAGLNEVCDRDLPATIFAAPHLLGRHAFWWDLLADAVTGAVDDALREHALTKLGGRQPEILSWADSQDLLVRTGVPDHARPATVELLRFATGRANITLASHGWSHFNLATASRRVLADELSRPIEWFDAHRVPHHPWIAFPYGRHSPAARRRARRYYSLAFTTAGGYAALGGEDSHDPMSIPRTNVPAGLTRRRFRLLTAGVIDLIRGRRWT